jgi:hypothetical protein
MIGSGVAQAPASRLSGRTSAAAQRRMDGAALPADRAMAAKIALGCLHAADLRRNNVTGNVIRRDG